MAEVDPKSIPRGSQRRPDDDFGSILEVKIHQKSIKNEIKFQIKFWKAFVIDFEWIWTYFWRLFLIKMTIKVEKGNFSKIIKNL